MATAEIRGRMSLDNQPFKRGVAEANQSVQSFASGQLARIGGMIGGAFAVGSLVNFARSTIHTADALADLSENLSIGIENLQALQYVASRTGSTAEGLVSVLSRVKRAMSEAAADAGGKTAANFKALGFTIAEISSGGLDVDRVVERMGRKIRDSAGAADVAAASDDILGKKSVELNSFLLQLANEGLTNITKKLLDMGLIIREDTVVALDQLDERMNRLQVRASVIGAKVMTAGMAIFYGFAEPFKALGAMLGGLSKEEAWQQALTETAEAFYGPAKPTIRALTPTELAAQKAAAAAEEEEARLRKFREHAVKAKELERLWDLFAKQGEPARKAEAKATEMRETFAKERAEALTNIAAREAEAADVLARRGIFVGGQTSPMQAVMRRQLDELEKIEEWNKRQTVLEQTIAQLLAD